MEKEFDYQGIARGFNKAFTSEQVIVFAVVPKYRCAQSFGSDDTYSCAVFAAARRLPQIEGALFGTRADGVRFMLSGSLMILEYTGDIKVNKDDTMPTFDYNGDLKQIYFMPTVAKKITAALMPATFKAEWPTDEEMREQRDKNLRKVEEIRAARAEAKRISDGYRAALHNGKPETPETIALYEQSAVFDFTFEYSDDHRYCIETRKRMRDLVSAMEAAGLNTKAFTSRVLGY